MDIDITMNKYIYSKCVTMRLWMHAQLYIMHIFYDEAKDRHLCTYVALWTIVGIYAQYHTLLSIYT